MLLLFFFVSFSKQAEAQCKLDRSNYRIVFQDEFNYKNAEELLVSGHWDIDGFNGSGTEFYTASQLEFPGGGILRLKANLLPPGLQRQQLDTQAAHDGVKRNLNIAYASGRIKSKIAYDSTYGPSTWRTADWTKGFAYGMFEIRCKLPAVGKGSWPAFWLLSPGSEIDVIDNNSDQPNRYLSSGVLDWDKRNSYCTAYGNAACDSLPLKAWTCGGRGFREGRDLSQDFNTYTVVWTPRQVSFFLNDREQYTVTKEQVNIHAYTSCIIASLQMRDDAEKLGISYAEMDIDYINVYKPIDGTYNISYDKSDYEYKNFKIQSPSNNWPEYINPAHKSISINSSNKNEVFFRGTNNLLYCSRRINNTNWTTTGIDPEQAQNPDWLIDGDVVFNSKYGIIVYRGRDGRLQAYSYYNTWHHQYLSSDVPSNWRISPTSGSIAIATNGDIYYAGLDHRIQLLHLSNSIWTHNYVDYTSTNDTSSTINNTLIEGDIILEETDKKVKIYYKGTDYRIHCLYPSDSNYTHTYLNLNESSTNSIVSASPGSITKADKNHIFFIGSDNSIYFYHKTDNSQKWQLDALDTSNNSHNQLPSQGNIVWDNDKKQIVYFGIDGRLQSFFQNNAGLWKHRWIDDYYNTPLFKRTFSQVNNTQFSSLIIGSDGDIFYRGINNEFHYFTYTGCRYINPNCENWNMNIALHKTQHLRNN